jgi:hypothetical protein
MPRVAVSQRNDERDRAWRMRRRRPRRHAGQFHNC